MALAGIVWLGGAAAGGAGLLAADRPNNFEKKPGLLPLSPVGEGPPEADRDAFDMGRVGRSACKSTCLDANPKPHRASASEAVSAELGLSTDGDLGAMHRPPFECRTRRLSFVHRRSPLLVCPCVGRECVRLAPSPPPLLSPRLLSASRRARPPAGDSGGVTASEWGRHTNDTTHTHTPHSWTHARQSPGGRVVTTRRSGCSERL